MMESGLQWLENRLQKRRAAQVDAQLAPAFEKASEPLGDMERVKRDLAAQQGMLEEHAARFRLLRGPQRGVLREREDREGVEPSACAVVDAVPTLVAMLCWASGWSLAAPRRARQTIDDREVI